LIFQKHLCWAIYQIHSLNALRNIKAAFATLKVFRLKDPGQ
jgi:hypothetical protein